jgi:hypothetical protein
MYEQEHPFEFERDGQSSLRDRTRAGIERDTLAARLGFSAKIPATMFDEGLLALATHCNLNISWYQQRLKKEMRARRGYFFVSLSMLLLIPLVIFVISRSTSATPAAGSATAGQATLVAAQLSALLTGLLAFQRGISAWLDRRQVVGGYSKASSDLKTILYTFEQTWDSMATNPVHATEFAAAIRAATFQCRQVVTSETDSFYQTLSYPTLDIGSLVKSASADATTIVKTFAPADAAADALAAASIESLRQKVDALDAQLTQARSKGDSNALAAVLPLRDSALKELRAAQMSRPALGTS